MLHTLWIFSCVRTSYTHTLVQMHTSFFGRFSCRLTKKSKVTNGRTLIHIKSNPVYNCSTMYIHNGIVVYYMYIIVVMCAMHGFDRQKLFTRNEWRFFIYIIYAIGLLSHLLLNLMIDRLIESIIFIKFTLAGYSMLQSLFFILEKVLIQAIGQPAIFSFDHHHLFHLNHFFLKSFCSSLFMS